MKKQTKYDPENLDFSNLENFQSIDVEQDWSRVRSRIGFRKTRRIEPLWQAAAVIILILSIGLLSKQYLLNPSELIVSTSGDEKKEVVLPDGSEVHLNVNSRLSYPEKFRRNSRNVSISGEGFFKIQRDPGKPFALNMAERATVEVLGTSFNVEAPMESNNTRIQVVEGSVAFYASGARDSRAILKKGDQAEIYQGQVVLNSTPDPNFLSWQTGILYFNQSPLADVVAQIEEHYGRNISLNENIPNDMVFTSTIDNQKLEDVLEEMSLVLKLTITYNPDTIRISK
jgi:ferric-dicitrate binding protein FerR (iron transport regulator)